MGLPFGSDQRPVVIRGYYALSNLLQELSLAKKHGAVCLELDIARIWEDPVSRIERYIKQSWWSNLTRQMDRKGIASAAPDPKNTRSQPRIYIPAGAPEQYDLYKNVAAQSPDMHLDVQWLPDGCIDPGYIKSLNVKPGILALDMVEDPNTRELKGRPFIVPGGRFNELYNWDSALCAWGMLKTHPHTVKGILHNFIFEIKHYGKILNANRSYYLGRSQPPFLTDLALKTYDITKNEPDAKSLLKHGILAAIKEYHDYWMSPPRLDAHTGLTRYRPIGAGFPPECEDGHFLHILAPYALKYEMSVSALISAYNEGKIHEPALDEFCLHDRAVRESGHDVSYRVEGLCADLATVDLNSLLYKYETDIADTIRVHFGDSLVVPAEMCARGQVADHMESSASWASAAERRKDSMNGYMWNEERGMFFDYNTRTHQQWTYESVTTLWPLWSGAASSHQASLLVSPGLSKFECFGGLSSTTEASRGSVTDQRPQKQWDFPFGWAPHQMLAWDGLRKYGYNEDAQRLVYRWLFMITKCYVEFGGAVVEKYDVTRQERPHEVEAEYGNEHLKFTGVPEEGYGQVLRPLVILGIWLMLRRFGWTNASYIYGLSIMDADAKKALGECMSWETYATTLR